MAKHLQTSLQFPPHPTPQDLFLVRVFEEPFVPTGAEPTAAENAHLADALTAYRKDFDPDDFSVLTGFSRRAAEVSVALSPTDKYGTGILQSRLLLESPGSLAPS
jgi:hypothetical protein